MESKPVKNNFAVIFDLDGVIVDSNPVHKIALRRFCRRHGIELSEEQLQTRIFGRTNTDWLRQVFGEKIGEAQIQQFAEEKEALFRVLIEPTIKPVKGLVEFLEKLKRNGIPRMIASSAPAKNVDFVLEKTGTRDYFPIILNETAVTHSKPHPEIYIKATQLLHLPPARCVVIEDSLSGIAAAQKAGCPVIGITTTHPPEELQMTDLVIADFEQLEIDHLERLVRLRVKEEA